MALTRVSQGMTDAVSIKRFGAWGNGTRDDTQAFKDARDWIADLSPGAFPEIVLEPGIYRITEKIAYATQFLKIRGAGIGRATGDTANIDGGSAILYDGDALTATEGVLEFNSGTAANRGIIVSDLSILCQFKGNGIYGAGADMFEISRVYFDQSLTGIRWDDTSYSGLIERCEFFDPRTGGIDLRSNCHSVGVVGNRFNNLYPGSVVTTENPDFALRIAFTANCSDVVVFRNSFDFYRVQRHIDWALDCKGGAIIGNYLECRDDSTTEQALYLRAGSGIVYGNRFTKSGTAGSTPIDYGVNAISTAHDWDIRGNYFSGFDTAAVRIASGATNINVGPQELLAGLTLVNDQNASPQSTTDNGGEISAKSITAVTTTKLAFGAPVEKTIASGVIDVDGQNYIAVDTEADASTDDLDTINGASADGQLLILKSADSTRDATAKDGTGNLQLAGDYTFASAAGKLMLIWNDGANQWEEISRSTN